MPARFHPTMFALATACVASGLSVRPLHAMQVADLRLFYSPIMGDEISADGTADRVDPIAGEFANQDLVFESGSHDRFGLSYRRSTSELSAGVGALTLGLELARDRVSLQQGSVDLDIDSWLVDAFIGWSWQVRPGWHLEQGLIGGLGRASWNLVHPGFFLDGTTWEDDASAFVSEYGFVVGTAYCFAEHLQIGADLGHLITTSRTTLTGVRDLGGGDIETVSWDVIHETKGFFLRAWVGYRF